MEPTKVDQVVEQIADWLIIAFQFTVMITVLSFLSLLRSKTALKAAEDFSDWLTDQMSDRRGPNRRRISTSVRWFSQKE